MSGCSVQRSSTIVFQAISLHSNWSTRNIDLKCIYDIGDYIYKIASVPQLAQDRSCKAIFVSANLTGSPICY